MDERSTLSEAHERATELEEDIRAASDPNAFVNIHIEPVGARIPHAEERTELAHAVQHFLIALPARHPELIDCHDVRVRSVEHRLLVSCHCAMRGNLPITLVHDITAALELSVKEHFPQIFRVTIHPEPVEESA